MKKSQFPLTSKIAHYSKTEDSKQQDYMKIVSAYKKLKSGIYTDVASYLNWSDPNKCSRRMKEMREMGLLENTGETKLTPRNRPAFIHKLSDSFNQVVKQISLF